MRVMTLGRHTVAVFILALFLAGAIYSQGIHGPFLLDDFSSIVDNPAVQPERLTIDSLIQAARSSSAGPLGRPVPMATFALDFLTDGLTPAPFKLTNILIHLAIGVLIFGLTRSLAQQLFSCSGTDNPAYLQPEFQRLFPLVVALIWLLHPLHVSTVLYVVQRMTQLSMLFAVAAVWVYVAARQRQIAGDVRGGWARIFVVLPPLLAASMYSKENGALLPVLLLAVEVAFFRFAFPPGSIKSRIALPGLLLLPSITLLVALFAVAWGAFSFPLVRDFTIGERLLTQARLLWVHVGQIVWPDLRSMPFYYDHYPVSRGMLEPRTTLLALFAWGGVLAATGVFIWRKRHPVFVFAVLWFIGGHLLESTSIPLEIGFEHRNYLPLYGFAFLLGWGLWQFGQSVRLNRMLQLAILASCLIGLSLQLDTRVRAWSSPAEFFSHTLEIAPVSARAWGDTAYFLRLSGRYKEAIEPLLRAAELNPKEAAYLIGVAGIKVNRLGELPDPSMVDEISHRLESYPLSAMGKHSLLSLLTAILSTSNASGESLMLAERLSEAASGNAHIPQPYRNTLTWLRQLIEDRKRAQGPLSQTFPTTSMEGRQKKIH